MQFFFISSVFMAYGCFANRFSDGMNSRTVAFEMSMVDYEIDMANTWLSSLKYKPNDFEKHDCFMVEKTMFDSVKVLLTSYASAEIKGSTKHVELLKKVALEQKEKCYRSVGERTRPRREQTDNN